MTDSKPSVERNKDAKEDFINLIKSGEFLDITALNEEVGKVEESEAKERAQELLNSAITHVTDLRDLDKSPNLFKKKTKELESTLSELNKILQSFSENLPEASKDASSVVLQEKDGTSASKESASKADSSKREARTVLRNDPTAIARKDRAKHHARFDTSSFDYTSSIEEANNLDVSLLRSRETRKHRPIFNEGLFVAEKNPIELASNQAITPTKSREPSIGK